MHLVFDIFQGMGIAAAAGIRPFLPTLVVGGLAAGDVEIHFNHTDYSFLQSAPFLLGMAVGAILLGLLELSRRGERVDREPLVVAIGAIGAALGAMMFAGSLVRGHYVSWVGLIAGVLCAAVAVLATRPLLVRVRGRLDPGTARALPVYAEGAAVVLAALSVVAPPVGLVGVLFLLWLLVAGRGRTEQKYAGLRILR
jgi:Domain of unknown function (DUF4126)